jgi:hypothetical protein
MLNGTHGQVGHGFSRAARGDKYWALAPEVEVAPPQHARSY